jgi:dCMP deaminase
MSANLEAIPKDTKVPPSGKVHFIEDWDEYFLAIAEIVACKSKDTNCQVGAVLVTPDSVVISTGYNGFARGVFDSENLLKDTDEKFKWICHAEVNAIWNAGRLGVPLKGCSIYVNKFPCFSCCNAIVQSGISRIYTHDPKYWGDDPFDPGHSRKRSLLKQSALKVEAPFHPDFRPNARLKRERIVTALGGESSI